MRKVVNILFLGGAKRVSVAKMFKAAGKELNVDVQLYSYELSAEQPIAEVAKVIPGLKWNDPELMADLHTVVAENAIDIVIPFLDPAVAVAAELAASIPECLTPGVDAKMANMFFDKLVADDLFRQLGVPVPKNAALETVEGEVIAKPRHGSASKGLKIMPAVELAAFRANNGESDYIFQEYIANREEYTVDAYATHAGTPVCVVPRRRIEVAGGEVTQTETVDDPEIVMWSNAIIEHLGISGPVTLQFLRDVDHDRRLMLMEINPRLGGGVVCSVHAGANIPKYILMEMLGQAVPDASEVHWKPGVRICRYPQEVAFFDGHLIV